MDIFKNQIMDNPNLQRCRTCLEQGRKLIPFSVMSTASKNTLHMSDIFMACASIQIAPNDGFSQYACSECVTLAEKAYLFKKQCEQSDTFWNEFSKRLKEKPISDQVTTSPNVPQENLQRIVSIQTPVDGCETDGDVTNVAEIIEIEFVEIDSDIKSTEINEDIEYEQFTCKLCFAIFLDEAKLSRHKLAHTIEPKRSLVKELAVYGCQECSIDTKTAEDFIEHCHNLHKNSIEKLYYRCKLCEGDFAKLSQLSTHVSKTHTPHRSSYVSRFECKICHQKFKTNDTLRHHQLVLHPKLKLSALSQSTWPQPCNYCEVSLNSHKERLAHIDQEHGDLKSFSCNKCGKTFLHEKHLLQHAPVHEEVKKFMCQHCGKGFKICSNLKTHIRIHTGEKPYKCDKCDASFIQWTTLRGHQLCHVQERNFECKECHKKYKSAHALHVHTQRHAVGPKYSCHLCPQQLKTPHGLKMHLLTHSNNRLFVCKVCEKEFNGKYYLREHMNAHPALRRYICSICNKGFTQSHCLRSHNARFHKDDTVL